MGFIILLASKGVAAPIEAFSFPDDGIGILGVSEFWLRHSDQTMGFGASAKARSRGAITKMMFMKFRKKPVVVEAIQWTGKNWAEVNAFVGKSAHGRDDSLWISTYEGVMTASVGDWIIKGVSGEFYPCKPDIFEKTYDAVES